MKNKVKVIVISLVILSLIVDLFIIKSYKKTYKVDNISVTEKYEKNNDKYIFSFKYKNESFEVPVTNEYIRSKKLIKKINKIDVTDGYCLTFDTKKVELYPVCYVDNEYISYHLVSDLKEKIDKKYYSKINSKTKKYESLEISYLNGKNYLIWNYNSFYYINSKKNKDIKLFNKDYYQIDLATKINEYLFIPNYDQGYSFSSAYVIDMSNGKRSKWNLDVDISSKSRVLGTHDKSIFIIDEKNKKEYEIVPHKKKIREVSGTILEQDKLVKRNIRDIINKNLSFNPTKNYNYVLEDHKLYLENSNKTRVLVSNYKVSKVIEIDNDTVYYLVDDYLYLYNNKFGNIKLITNFEWSFNNDNNIFIY